MIHHVKTFFTSAVVLRVATVFILVAGLLAGLWFWVMPSGPTGATAIAKGVLVGGVYIGGLSQEQASQRLGDRIAALRLSYSMNGANAVIDPNEVYDGVSIVTYDIDQALREAYSVGRDKSRLRAILQ